jgi:putative ABC transport system substrate-binding protein
MRRRDFIGALGGVAATWPLAARAQQSGGKIARIGFVGTTVDNPITSPGYPAFLDELKKSGFSVGQNLTI